MPKTANRQTIAVDIDDVLVPHVQDLIAWHNRQYGTKMTMAHYRSRDPQDWGAKTIEQAIERVQKFFVTPDFLEARPIAEAKEVLNKLSNRYDLIVITARDTIIEDATHNWLGANFPKLFKQIHFTARFNLQQAAQAKSDVAAAASAQYLIDDSLENIPDIFGDNLEFLLFGDYPWNRLDKLPKGVTRVRNWQEVLEYFDAKG